jgi:hypothetical protein
MPAPLVRPYSYTSRPLSLFQEHVCEAALTVPTYPPASRGASAIRCPLDCPPPQAPPLLLAASFKTSAQSNYHLMLPHASSCFLAHASSCFLCHQSIISLLLGMQGACWLEYDQGCAKSLCQGNLPGGQCRTNSPNPVLALSQWLDHCLHRLRSENQLRCAEPRFQGCRCPRWHNCCRGLRAGHIPHWWRPSHLLHQLRYVL